MATNALITPSLLGAGSVYGRYAQEEKMTDIARPTETIASAKTLIEHLLDENIPCFVEGPPGVGKSEMWRQIAHKRGIGFIDLRLGQMDPVDLRGLPKHMGDYTTWARPDFWPTEDRDGKKGIILFDEMSDANRAMQSASYQIILDHRAGPHVIPPGWYCCAAGNRREDKAAAQQISTALANRFAWIEVGADAECTYEYGTSMGWHHYVLGYLKFRPSHVHSMEGATTRAFASPRTWERVARGKICDAPQAIRYKLIAANVGLGIASEFEGYLKVLDLPSFKEIETHPTKAHIPEQPGSKYALSSMISRYLDTKNFSQVIKYLKRPEFGRDFEVSCVLDAAKRDSALCEHAAYTDFIDRNSSLQL